MTMTTPALTVAFLGMLPLVLVVIASDLKRMKIPNWTVGAIFVLFLATGSWGLPLDVFGWRILYAVIALVLGFGLYSVASGGIGAGDLKLIAAFVPFVPGSGVTTVMLLFVISAFGLVLVHQAARIATRKRETGWKSLDQAVYLPAGVALGLTMVVFLGLDLGSRLA